MSVLSMREEKECQVAVENTRIPGGHLEFRHENIAASHITVNSIDGIVVRCLLEPYPLSERLVLAEQFYKWLRPGGMLILQTEAGVPGEPEPVISLPSELESIGFLDYNKVKIASNSGEDSTKRLPAIPDAKPGPLSEAKFMVAVPL